MRAVVFRSVGQVAVEDRPMPQILDPRDSIIKVTAAALCGSDLHWYRGHQNIPGGFIPGHEFIGRIYELGNEVKGFEIGDLVIATFSTQCGDCFYCQKGQTSRCAQSLLFGNSAGTTSIDGGQAEYVRVPFATTTLVLAPKGIPEKLLLLMADIFPTGYFASSRFLRNLSEQEAKNTVVAVVGCGPVGICAIASALTWSDTVYAIDLVPERLAQAEKIGAKPLLLTNDPVTKIMDATEGRGADVVLEVVGSPEAVEMCIDLARPFGQVSSVGVQTGKLEFNGPALYGKNITIAWGRCPVRGIFDEALSCLIKVEEKVTFLCDHSMKLEEAAEAYELFSSRKVHKVVLYP